MIVQTFLKDNFRFFKIAGGLLLIYFCLFYQLGSRNLMDWDEARVAKSSYEMSKNNNFIAVMYDGNPDFWSTKPSFLHTIQSLFIKAFGLSALSVRLPSAICGFLLCLLLYAFLTKVTKNKVLAFLSVLVFVTAPAVLWEDHSFRTADYDAMVVFAMFASSVSIFLFFENQHKKWLYLFFIFLLTAVLTKGIAGLFYTPGIVLFALYKKQVLPILKNKHFYFSLLCLVIPCLIYFFLREKLTPGYLQALNDNEILGRYHNTHEASGGEPVGNFGYYFNFIIENRFSYFYLLVPSGLVIGLFSKNKILKDVCIYSGLLITGVLTIITLSIGKNIWYDFAVYPYLAILTAVCLFYLYDLLSNVKFNSAPAFSKLLPSIFLTAVFIFPCIQALSLVTESLVTTKAGYGYNNVMQDYIKENKAKNNNIVALSREMKLTQSQKFSLDLAKEKNINLIVKKNTFNVGDILIVMHKQTQVEIENTYRAKLLEAYREINVYQIISKK